MTVQDRIDALVDAALKEITPPPGAISPSADEVHRFLVNWLRARGWSVIEKGPEEPPLPMAQLAAAEADGRKVILYVPMLRFLAEQTVANQDRGGAQQDHSGAGLQSEDAFLQWKCAALAHEIFHVLSPEPPAPSFSGKDQETAAHLFAQRLISALAQGKTLA